MNYVQAAVLAALVAAGGAVRADTTDVAEAARRGVPVAQVEAEKAAAREKDKQAELERQIGDLKRQIGTLSSKAGEDQGARGSAASGPTTRGDSPWYEDFVNRYLMGKWENLAKDMTAKEKEIGALPAEYAADIRYIKQAVAEGRPAWWDGVKNGKTTDFEQTVWKQTVRIKYEPKAPDGVPDIWLNGGVATYGVHWSAGDMDSGNPMLVEEFGFLNKDDFSFRKADLAAARVWESLGIAGAMAQEGVEQKFKNPPADVMAQMRLFEYFRMALTVAYYGTPPARRLTLAQCCGALIQPVKDTVARRGRRPLGAALLIELAVHKDRYTHLGLASIDNSNLVEDNHKAEEFLGNPLMNTLVITKLSLKEDRQLRDLVKTLVESNPDWRSTKVSLGSQLACDMDEAKDVALAGARMAVIKSGKLPGK